MAEKTLIPDFIFETSWEVCNKVGGIYTVLSSRAKTLQEAFPDQICFIGPDLGQTAGDASLFEEDPKLLTHWKKSAAAAGIGVRIGRWGIPGRPVALLVDFKPYFAQKNEIYARAWEYFQVDSLHGYGDYDEASMFSYAAGQLAECICRQCLPPTARIVYQAHEWMSGLGMLFLKHNLPRVATLFTTHATSIGRSIAGNNKLLYEYFDGYHGDQMAAELNMQSKHSIEKQSAHRADCFTTVSDFTARECAQLLDKAPDVVLPNGFEPDFVPRGAAFTRKRKAGRARILQVADALMGTRLPDDTLIVATSGRNDFRCKGFDVYLEALSRLSQQPAERPVLALIEVPCWLKEPRADLQTRLASGQSAGAPLDSPNITHWLYNMDEDRILSLMRQKGLVNAPASRVKVLLVPCYLDGRDGIFNLPYYDLLIASDLCVYPSYYEPWGYTPLEAAAFKIPCVTTDLSGFGQWVDTTLGHAAGLADGVEVIHRTDLNYFDVVEAICQSVRQIAAAPAAELTAMRRRAAALAERAQWKHFIRYYYEAYDFALRHARPAKPTLF